MIDTAQAATIRLGAETLERFAVPDVPMAHAAIEATTDAIEATTDHVTELVTSFAKQLMDDAELRRAAIIGGASVAVIGVGIYAWRRRRAKRDMSDLNSSIHGVPGWQTPAEAFSDAQ